MSESLNNERRRIREHPQVLGDYKPSESPDPVAGVLARVYALILSWPAAEPEEQRLEGTR